MDLIYQWFQSNLDIVFFIYGLAFVTIGVAIFVQYKKGSEFKIANILWLLALFGITHGTNELLYMWAIIKGLHPILDLVRWFVLLISYFFLFEFGRQLFRLTPPKSPVWQKKIAEPLVWWLLPVIGVLIFIFGFMSFDFWKAGTIWTRYLLGFPGGLLIGFGFFSYYKQEKEILEPLKVRKYFLFAGLSFLIYGILGGTVVPKGSFSPSSWLNTDSFFLTVKIPVQAFRTICAITAAWAVGGMLKIFNWETMSKLQEAQALEHQLKESEKRYRDITENSQDIIHSINTDGFIIFTNRAGYELLGYSTEELIGKHLKEIYTPETWKDIERGFEKLKLEGSIFIDNGKMIRRDGEKLDVAIHSLAMYDSKGNFVGTRAIIRDVTEHKKMEELILQSKHDWDDTFNTITDMITIHDKDFNIIRANKAAEKVLKLPSLSINKIIKCFEYYHGKDCPPEGCPSCQCLKTGIPANFELFEPHLNMFIEIRAIPRFDSNNELIGLIHVVRDITKRKKIEEEHNKLLDAVTKAKVEWEMTFDSAMELIMLVDKELNIIRCNKSFAKFTGKPFKELIGYKCHNFFSCEHKQIEYCKDHLDNTQGSLTKTEVKTETGHWFYVSHRPILDEKRGLLYTVIIATDITELKNTQQRLLESEQELKKRVDELEKFYSMAVDRELRMKELKKEIERLNTELSHYKKE